jgi:hypothetical protein
MGRVLEADQSFVWVHKRPRCLLLSVRNSFACHLHFVSVHISCFRLHNICQEDTEFKRILQASRQDAAFDAALLDSLQEHDPADLTWRRTNEAVQPSGLLFNPRNDLLLFLRGDMVAGFRNDLVGGKRKHFTTNMETRGVKRPKHSADAARARRYGE